MDSRDQTAGTIRGPRHSACATASLKRESERLRGLSIEARVKDALSIGTRFSWLKPTPLSR